MAVLPGGCSSRSWTIDGSAETSTTGIGFVMGVD
jgi:hypothetical protein